MPKGYRHLTYEERCQISALKGSGRSNGEIARQLGRDPATVGREVRRNGGEGGYAHAEAQARAEARRSAASSVPGKMTPELWAQVEGRLREGWSPEQVSGRLRLEGLDAPGREWIYRHVRADREAGGTLWKCLRRRGKRPNRKGGAHAGRGHIPGRVDISERPAAVEEKKRVGDWEADTVVGKGHSGAVVTLVDRATKLSLFQRLDSRKSDEVCPAVVDMLLSVSAPVLTVTSDNGKEFAGHAAVSEALGAGFFFARPYHSWERGLNEHTNGLLREYFPKGTDFRKVTDGQVREVQDILNARPRKALGYLTPEEAYRQARPP